VPRWRDVIALTLDELNPPKRQGAAGRPLAAIVCDDGSDSAVAADLARSLIAQGVPVVMTDGSSDTVNVAGVAVPAGVLTMSGSAISPEVTALAASPNNVRLVWRTSPSDANLVRVLAREIAGDAGADGSGAARKIGVFARDDAYGQSVFDTLRAAYPGRLDEFLFQPGGADVPRALAAAAASRPQLKMLIGFQDDYTTVLNAAEDPAYAPIAAAPWYFTQGARFPELFTSLKNPARIEGTLGAWSVQHIDSPAYAWLVTQFTQKAGVDPGSISYLPYVFDELMLAAIAAAVAVATQEPVDGTNMALTLARVSAVDSGPLIDLDPDKFNEAVSTLVAGTEIDVEGSSGHLNFDPVVGEAPAEVEIWRVADGGFESVRVVSP
jgi:branched-chain amino acid transport system substrate-binding protein